MSEVRPEAFMGHETQGEFAWYFRPLGVCTKGLSTDTLQSPAEPNCGDDLTV